MKSYISIFSMVLLMASLITNNGCKLTEGDILGDTKDTITVTKTEPSSLVGDENLVSEIRGNDNGKTPGFTFTYSAALTDKYVNVALVKFAGAASGTLVYLNSMESATLGQNIKKGDPEGQIHGTWNVVTATDTTYYIYIWTTKEQYTGLPIIGTYKEEASSKVYNDLIKGKTPIAVVTSGNNKENKYYATGS